MKGFLYYFIGLACVGGLVSANAESLLKVASFPNTFDDLPFTARMDVLAEGYGELESIYDADGKCIAGCPYAGITIEKETEAIQRNSQLANVAANTYINKHPDIPSSNQQRPDNPLSPTQHNTSGENSGGTTTYTCTQYRTARRTEIPLNSPIDANIQISSDFGPRKAPTEGATSWHKGVDISIPTGNNVYATGDGVIERIWNSGSGGRAVLIKHNDTNFYTAYFHLSDNHIVKKGDKVQAGCLIGKSGNTGISTGPHLHYTIYYTRPGKKFSYTDDPIDPLWEENRFGTEYRFKSQSVKSCLHTAHNFCGIGRVPPDTLPGEIK